jgi:predicted tellurium resistance membrane protein TerC
MEILELLQRPETYATLIMLSGLEIILGVDNIIFISIITGRLPGKYQQRARLQGILLALVFRIILLLSISWLVKLTEPLVLGFSGRDLVLLGGGIFLIVKSVLEIKELFSEVGESHGAEAARKRATSYWSIVAQVIVIDIVFSFDSVITAVGLVKEIPIMIAAIVIAMIVMLSCAEFISRFVNQNPTMKMLALAFLVLIGVLLCLEGFHIEVPKSYVYAAVSFSLAVEILNMKLRKKSAAAHEPIPNKVVT